MNHPMKPPPEQRRHERSSQDPEVIERRFTAGSERMDRIEAMVIASKTDIEEVLQILRMAKSFFKLAGHIGSFVKWAAAVGAPVVAFWYALKAGGKS